MTIYRVEKDHWNDGQKQALGEWFFSTKRKAETFIDNVIVSSRNQSDSITDKHIGRCGIGRSVKIFYNGEYLHYKLSRIEVE